MVNVPTNSDVPNPQYLPDPRDGSLYQLGDMGGLKKLPYTIPQLVANAPCRSSDGILYSGKKSDTWFLIDPKTGQREKVLGKYTSCIVRCYLEFQLFVHRIRVAESV